jgi:AraC family transcriptional regulator of adaptative response/methylated-DNA-[protein]-cysteine methyltransferase
VVHLHPVILYTQIIETPIGAMFAAVNEDGIYIFDYVERKGGLAKIQDRVAKKWSAIYVQKKHAQHEALEQQLQAYFKQERHNFDLPLHLSGTEFQQQVFRSLQAIPYSKTISYQQLSLQMNRPQATRAIAKANGENCLAILIPCHRVIASNGLLTGYSGGIEVKKWLLDFEQGRPNMPLQPSLF